jgi:hypothetical protein
LQKIAEVLLEVDGEVSFSGSHVAAAVGDTESDTGKFVEGLGLPDVVRTLVRDPAILKWDQVAEVYEVIDGQRFESR